MPAPKVQVTKEQLSDLYCNQEMSLRRIAAHLGLHKVTVERLMQKYDIKRRSNMNGWLRAVEKRKIKSPLGFKWCSRCQADLPLHSFQASVRKRAALCSRCRTEYDLERAGALKQQALDFLGGKCKHCGFAGHSAAMDIHHREPLQKELSWNRLQKRSWPRILKELEKCDLLCSNCHRTHHAIKLDVAYVRPAHAAQPIVVLPAHDDTWGRRRLEELYVGRRFSLREVGARLGLSGNGVKDRLKRHGIPTRPKVNAWLRPREAYEISSPKGKRWCSNCQEHKPGQMFATTQRKGSGTAYCLPCLRLYDRERTNDLKGRAVEYLGGACMSCGFKENLAALDFHHTDPLTKDVNWDKLRKRTWEGVLTEVQKCTLLCSNCHRIHHAEERNQHVGNTPQVQ